jgi:cellulose synthase/poly-beta-1,6-N-acetylglucosamine synthase-like glycosyltransferase
MPLTSGVLETVYVWAIPTFVLHTQHASHLYLAGTNFCLRARSLAAVGWFPEYTITEDYALSMELKSAGFKGTYLNEYLAVGEAPDEIRNVCRQRSRYGCIISNVVIWASRAPI